MRPMTSAKLRETRYDDEQELLRMNDEGCPNNPLFILPSKTGIEGACEILGQILDHPEALTAGATAPQPLLDLVGAVRSRLTMKLEEKLDLEDEGDIISAIISHRK